MKAEQYIFLTAAIVCLIICLGLLFGKTTGSILMFALFASFLIGYFFQKMFIQMSIIERKSNNNNKINKLF